MKVINFANRQTLDYYDTNFIKLWCKMLNALLNVAWFQSGDFCIFWPLFGCLHTPKILKMVLTQIQHTSLWRHRSEFKPRLRQISMNTDFLQNLYLILSYLTWKSTEKNKNEAKRPEKIWTAFGCVSTQKLVKIRTCD